MVETLLKEAEEDGYEMDMTTWTWYKSGSHISNF